MAQVVECLPKDPESKPQYHCNRVCGGNKKPASHILAGKNPLSFSFGKKMREKGIITDVHQNYYKFPVQL
jgi:hypothetical protein